MDAQTLFSQYQPRIQELGKGTEDVLRDYYAFKAQEGTFAQKLLDAIKQAGQYPSNAAIRAEYMQNPNLTPAAIEANVARRSQSTRGTIQDVMSRAQGGVSSDATRLQGIANLAQIARENLMGEYGMAREALPPVVTPSATERESTRMTGMLKADVQNGMLLKDVIQLYGNQVSLPDILNIYNTNSPYGPAKESIGEISKMGFGDQAAINEILNRNQQNQTLNISPYIDDFTPDQEAGSSATLRR